MRITHKLAAVLVASAAVAGLVATGSAAQAAESAADKKPAPSHSHALPSSQRPDKVAAKQLPAATEKAVRTLQARVRGYVAAHGTAYTFGTYANVLTGKIVMDTNAPDQVVRSLTVASRSPLAAEANSKLAAVQVVKAKASDQYSRRDDVPSYYGGGGITDGGGICSSGYAVTNSTGGRWMVTAGHCFAIGTAVRTELNGRAYGSVTNRALASLGQAGLDMELINGASYAGRIFTGGVDSTSSAPVVAAGSAVQGFTNYCHSGRTSGESCGHKAISTSAQVCTATGCKTNVIAWQGGQASQGGDSGSPFYVKDANGGVWIRGHVIAGDGTTSYSEKWDKVAARYGVSIVTG